MKQLLTRGFNVFIAFLLSISTLNVFVAPNASAVAPDKVFVCKYVGTPGVNETLQTGTNPISVSVNTIPNYQGVDSYFADAQGQSYVLAVDDTAPGPAGDPTVDACPAPATKPTGYLTINVACEAGSFSGTVTLPKDGVATYKVNGNATEPGSYTGLTPGEYTVEMFVNDTLVDSQTVQVSKCSDEPTIVPVPMKPDSIDPCGLDNAQWLVPQNTEAVSWGVEDGSLIVKANAGYVFPNELNHINFGKPYESENKCVALPERPSIDDPCGPRNASWIVPVNTDNVRWVLTANKRLKAAAQNGYVFSNGDKVVNFGKAKKYDSNEKCPVVPSEPYGNDFCGEMGDSYWIPGKKGVKYKVDGAKKRTKAGLYSSSAPTHTITAFATKGYVLDPEAQSQWVLEFNNDDCIEIEKKAVAIADTNNSGQVDFGDTVEWEITVTNTSPYLLDTFYVELEDEMAVIDGDNFIEELGAGGSATFAAYSTLQADQIEACEATNTASYQARFTKPSIGEEIELFNEFNDDNGEYDILPFTGSDTASIGFDCPTPGQGSTGDDEQDEPAPATVKTVSQDNLRQLPAELPYTGPENYAALLFGLMFSLLTYGAVYFAQNRRTISE